jgi:hypothetical protein
VNSLTCHMANRVGSAQAVLPASQTAMAVADLGEARLSTHLLHLICQLAAQELEAVEADLQVT